MLHHKKADQIIATWDKHICCPEVVQRVPLLFLANDILPSIKTKVNRFISRFWKILPSALKEVVENGKADERKVVFGLIYIWEREKVFGSLSQSLKDILLGEGSPPPLDLGKKCSGSVTITKRDEQSIRTKLSIGGSAEKIVSAFELVLHEHANKDKQTRKCNSAVHRVEKLEKSVDKALKKVAPVIANILGIRTSKPPETDTAEAQAAKTANMIQCLGDKEDRLVVELKLPFANAKYAHKSVSEMAAELC
ncbi:UNVERIFIED_CONTAM: hypothetical protein Sangu_2462300 [Sesamum angustifolium]|uniref:CID domain-containing protein n=1 Tax=Sesamum angustifolium TaxID=2727405 RepID=A0AAW2JTL0_9LAMI